MNQQIQIKRGVAFLRSLIRDHNAEFNVVERGAACKFVDLKKSRCRIEGTTAKGSTFIEVEPVDALNFRVVECDSEKSGFVGTVVGADSGPELADWVKRVGSKIRPGTVITRGNIVDMLTAHEFRCTTLTGRFK